MNLVDNFNETSILFLDLIYNLTNDSDITYYKKILKRIIFVNKKKVIENFIINCYPYFEYIINRDINYFMNLNLDDRINKDSILKVIKIKKLFINLEFSDINMIIDYLNILVQYSIEYTKRYKVKV